MKIYKVNINGDFKVKREININDYIVWDCSGSSGITLKHKKNGKTIFLATKEFFDNCKDSYKNQLENIGKYFSYVYDENRKKIRYKHVLISYFYYISLYNCHSLYNSSIVIGNLLPSISNHLSGQS